MEIKFTIPVKPVTKKNSGQIITRGKYPKLIPSKQYLQFEKDTQPYFRRVKLQTDEIYYPVNVQCLFYMETRRKVDLCNLLNAVDDAAVEAGLFIDDNRDIIAAHDGSRVYHDPANPRIEVTITELKDYTQWRASEQRAKA